MLSLFGQSQLINIQSTHALTYDLLPIMNKFILYFKVLIAIWNRISNARSMLKFSFDLVVLISFSELVFESIISYSFHAFSFDCHVLDFIKIHLLGLALFFF